MKRIPPWGIFVAFCGFITLLAGISLVGLVIGFLRQDLMAFGVTFAGHPLSGLTKEEAEREIARYVEEKLISPALILTYEDKRWEAAPADVGLFADVSATVAHAFAVGREGSAWQRGTEVLLTALRQRDIPLAVRVDQAALDAYLAPIANEVQRLPKDAVCNVAKDGKVLRQEAAEGRRLDAAALADEIKPALYALRLPARVVLAPETTPPQVTTEDVAFVDTVLGVYTTYYVSASNRGENIEIAAASLNHRLIKSGGSFSFNDVVGKRVAAAGYLTAPVIVDGKVEEDFGGGVCQVSSTLYNAILLANLTPTQRVPHFYPSSYVPAGRDATVADGQIDFCFENRLPHSVYLLAEAGEDTLTIRVLGCAADVPEEISIETAVVGPNPIVDSYRVYERGGVETAREFLYTDEYDIPPPPEKKPAPANSGARAGDGNPSPPASSAPPVPPTDAPPPTAAPPTEPQPQTEGQAPPARQEPPPGVPRRIFAGT